MIFKFLLFLSYFFNSNYCYSINWNGNNWAESCDFSTPSFSAIETNRDNCYTECLMNSECSHYVWSNYKYGTCWLKSGYIKRSDAILNDDFFMICGIVDENNKNSTSNTIKWSNETNYIWSNSCNFINNNEIEINIEMDKEDCVERCLSMYHCSHFSWNSDFNGLCSIKTGNVNKEDALIENVNIYDHLCGIIINNINNNTCLNWKLNSLNFLTTNNCEWESSSYKSFSISFDQCSLECNRDEKCTHFLWKSKYKGGTCWLKSRQIFKNDTVCLNDITSFCGLSELKVEMFVNRTILWREENDAIVATFCRFESIIFKTITKTTFKLCSTKCSSVKECTHFNWNNNEQICYLFESQITKSDAIKTQSTSDSCGIINKKTIIDWTKNEDWSNGCEFESESFIIVHTLTGNSCRDECLTHLGCTHYNWTRYKYGTCLLMKGSITPYDSVPYDDVNSICGIIQDNNKI
jgi:hypothetical protein